MIGRLAMAGVVIALPWVITSANDPRPVEPLEQHTQPILGTNFRVDGASWRVNGLGNYTLSIQVENALLYPQPLVSIDVVLHGGLGGVRHGSCNMPDNHRLYFQPGEILTLTCPTTAERENGFRTVTYRGLG